MNKSETISFISTKRNIHIIISSIVLLLWNGIVNSLKIPLSSEGQGNPKKLSKILLQKRRWLFFWQLLKIFGNPQFYHFLLFREYEAGNSVKLRFVI